MSHETTTPDDLLDLLDEPDDPHFAAAYAADLLPDEPEPEPEDDDPDIPDDVRADARQERHQQEHRGSHREGVTEERLRHGGQDSTFDAC